MTILGLQGISGGVGTTSLTAALGWALQLLGEPVLMVDASADNLLRLFFNVEFSRREGWARSLLDDKNWQNGAWRYTSQLDLLPFGQLDADERTGISQYQPALGRISDGLQTLKASGRYRWILLDLPAGYDPLTRQLLAQCDNVLTLLRPDASSHIRLHQQPLPDGTRLLINQRTLASQVEDDICQLWLQSQPALVPVVIHRDEAMCEALAAKQPLGEYRAEALAAEEVMTLANWCILHYSGGQG